MCVCVCVCASERACVRAHGCICIYVRVWIRLRVRGRVRYVMHYRYFKYSQSNHTTPAVERMADCRRFQTRLCLSFSSPLMDVNTGGIGLRIWGRFDQSITPGGVGFNDFEISNDTVVQSSVCVCVCVCV